MGRPPGARNKPKETVTAERGAETMPEQTSSKGEVAHFEPARLPYHPAIEERFGVDKGQWKVLVEAIYPAAKTVDAIIMALSYCKVRNLDPFKRPVHIVPMWDSQRGAMVETVWPGISELRTTASRTKGYAGIDAAEFGDEITETFEGRVRDGSEWKSIKLEMTFPAWCRMTVYRMVDGQRCKFVGPKVAWLETYATQGKTDLPNNMWQTRPEGQLEKCAEAGALRRAFPEELGNELTAEEMIGRDIHSIAGEITHVASDAAPATAGSRDTAPPRAVPQQLPPEVESAEEVQDGNPPPRPPKAETPKAAPPKEDPISSGPPRSAPPKQAPKPTGDIPKPHRIPGTGHTYESWAEKYCDCIKTSPDMATMYAWIDTNSKDFVHPTDPQQRQQIGPLKRLETAKPSVYATVRKTTEQIQQAFRDANEKAQQKTQEPKKAAAPPSDMDGGMDDKPAQAASGPANPEAILKRIDAELGAVEDPDQLQVIWDSVVEPLLKDLFPPDQDEAQSMFHKHEKRLGGD